MVKTSVVNNAIRLGYNRVNGAKIGISMDGAGIINKDKPKKAKDEINIIAREKQKNANIKIYYILKQE